MSAVGRGVAALLLTVPALAAADERRDVLEMRAESLVQEARCSEALPLLDELRALDPHDARTARLAGGCRIAEGDYAGALEDLDRAASLSPDLGEVSLYRAIALYHLERHDEAALALEAARGHTDDLAQLELYAGFLLLAQGEHRDAALAFERARAEGGERVEPVASYYAGLAWRQEREGALARESFERVTRTRPESDWARRAEEALVERPPRRFWAQVTAGLEYDSNVVLRGDGVSLPADISDEGDLRGIWFGEWGTELFRSGDWSGGVLASYWGAAHTDLDDFDSHSPAFAAWLERRIGERTVVRARYDTGFDWVDNDPFRFTQNFTGSVHQVWERAGVTSLSSAFHWNDYRFDTLGTRALDRDGTGNTTALEHSLPLGYRDVTVRAGYRFQNYDSQGSEYQFDAHRVLFGAAGSLPGAIHLDASASFTHQPFRNASVFATPGSGDREDQSWQTTLVAERQLTERISVLARYSYRDNRSNTDVFDFDCHVGGVFLRVTLP